MEQSSKGRTHYQVLGVSPCATLDQIKAAHRALALKYHPDKNTSAFESQFLAIQKAWECLRDETSRQEYDDKLTRQNQPKHINTIPLNDLEVEECDLEEENEDDGTITTITTTMYTYSCQCGTILELFQHELSMDDKSTSIPWQCHGCSVQIQIIK